METKADEDEAPPFETTKESADADSLMTTEYSGIFLLNFPIFCFGELSRFFFEDSVTKEDLEPVPQQAKERRKAIKMKMTRIEDKPKTSSLQR